MDLKMSREPAISNLKKFATKLSFAFLAPFITRFIVGVCDQIKKNEYDKTDYLKRFSKIKLGFCTSFEFVLIYKVIEIFLSLKRANDKSKVSFSTIKPNTNNIVLPEGDEELKSAETKLKMLKTVITSARIGSKWNEYIEKFKQILKGKSDEVFEELGGNADDVAQGNLSSAKGLELLLEGVQKNKDTPTSATSPTQKAKHTPPPRPAPKTPPTQTSKRIPPSRPAPKTPPNTTARHIPPSRPTPQAPNQTPSTRPQKPTTPTNMPSYLKSKVTPTSATAPETPSVTTTPPASPAQSVPSAPKDESRNNLMDEIKRGKTLKNATKRKLADRKTDGNELNIGSIMRQRRQSMHEDDD